MSAILGIVIMAVRLYSLILLIRVILSWVPNVDRNHPAIRLLYDVTEPVLRPIREILPPTPGLDLSPLVLLLALNLVIWLLPTVF